MFGVTVEAEVMEMVAVLVPPAGTVTVGVVEVKPVLLLAVIVKVEEVQLVSLLVTVAV